MCLLSALHGDAQKSSNDFWHRGVLNSSCEECFIPLHQKSVEFLCVPYGGAALIEL